MMQLPTSRLQSSGLCIWFISIESQVRFLGMIINDRLTYFPHIVILKVSCHRSLNLLRHLTSITWGCGQQNLISIVYNDWPICLFDCKHSRRQGSAWFSVSSQRCFQVPYLDFLSSVVFCKGTFIIIPIFSLFCSLKKCLNLTSQLCGFRSFFFRWATCFKRIHHKYVQMRKGLFSQSLLVIPLCTG